MSGHAFRCASRHWTETWHVREWAPKAQEHLVSKRPHQNQRSSGGQVALAMPCDYHIGRKNP